MGFLRSSLVLRWLKSNKMVEYEPLIWEGWQEDATLFPSTESNGLLNFDELLEGKINNEEPLNVDCNDLNWLDEKVDLSAILQNPPTEEQCRLLDEAVNLFFDSTNIDSYLSSNLVKNETNILNTACINGNQDPIASENEFTFTFPSYEPISEANSPASSFVDRSEDLTSSGVCLSPPGQVVPAEFCLSPSYCSTPRERLSSDDLPLSPNEILYSNTPGEQSVADDICHSPDFSSLLGSPEAYDVFSPSPSELTSSTSEEIASKPSVSVVVCDLNPETILSDSKDLSIEEVTRSVRKRKFVSNGRQIPKVRVSLDNVFHPYKKKSESSRPRNKNERKKVQNKEAAARYRTKKRLEQQEITDEVSTLESQQKDLQKKHDSLVSEIKYLKSLMCEMLQKRGVLK